VIRNLGGAFSARGREKSGLVLVKEKTHPVVGRKKRGVAGERLGLARRKGIEKGGGKASAKRKEEDLCFACGIPLQGKRFHPSE